MTPLIERLENPIFVKHVRARLRLQPLISSMIVVFILCLCITWGGYVLDGYDHGQTFGVLMALQFVILVIIGSSQIGASIGGARASGILDFHRVSPLSPTVLTLGFFFGGPVREYVLFACTLPFSLFCVVMGSPQFEGFLSLMILQVFTAWVFHGLALVSSLVTKKPKQAVQGAIGMVVFVVVGFSSLLSGLYRAAMLVEGSPKLSFFGVALPWLPVVLLYEGSALFFILLAARRKLSSERAHAFSKPQAVAALATLTGLLLGGLWGAPNSYDYLATVVLYVLIVVSIMLIPAVTPNLGEYVKGIRRAEKQGGKRMGLWSDTALNRVVLSVICAVVLAGSTVAWTMFSPGNPNFGARADPNNISKMIAIGVLVVAYYGLALQYFQLAFPKRGTMYFGLFLFLAWLVPVLAGTILSASGGFQGGNETGAVVMSLSPIVGLAMTANPGPGFISILSIQAATVCPALVFAFLFNGLVTRARRRADRAIHVVPDATVAAIAGAAN